MRDQADHPAPRTAATNSAGTYDSASSSPPAPRPTGAPGSSPGSEGEERGLSLLLPVRHPGPAPRPAPAHDRSTGHRARPVLLRVHPGQQDRQRHRRHALTRHVPPRTSRRRHPRLRPSPHRLPRRTPLRRSHQPRPLPSRTSSATQARTACASLNLLGQAARSSMLLDDPSELADDTRAVEKIYNNSHHLHRHPPTPPATSTLTKGTHMPRACGCR